MTALGARLAAKIRNDAVYMARCAGSGHPTSVMSAADVAGVLFTEVFRADWRTPDSPRNDVLVLSKGHASTLMYSVLNAAGVVPDEALSGYRRHGSMLSAHPTNDVPGVPVATGSLGQGVGVAVGVAQARARMTDAGHVWVLCGDGELAEGSVWEAFDAAGRLRLGNLTILVDVNGLEQTGPAPYGRDVEELARRVTAFGLDAYVVDGHDHGRVRDALVAAKGGPAVVLARTVKGKGAAAVEGAPGWHGKPLAPGVLAEAAAPYAAPDVRAHLTAYRHPPAGNALERPGGAPPRVDMPGVAIRDAFGRALVALGADPRVVVVDADVQSATRTEWFAAAYPERFVQCHIAEQLALATAAGFATQGFRPWFATFAAFLTRAHDFLRMAAISRLDLAVVGTHAGVEIGQDGASQMGLEDIAMMSALPASTVLCPSDAASAEALVAIAADLPGIRYLRVTRGAYPDLPATDFAVGGCRWFGDPDDSDVAVFGCGVTVHEALAARATLAERGVRACVVDVYGVKPLDGATVDRAAAGARGACVVVEDHRPEGGLGSALFARWAVSGIPVRAAHLAVRTIPRSALPAQQLADAGIDAAAIVAAVCSLDLAGIG